MANIFEAIRNLRFLFEGSIYAVVIEDVIERVVYERWDALSGISLKQRSLNYGINANEKGAKERDGINVDKVKEIVASFINKHATNLPDEDKRLCLFLRSCSDFHIVSSKDTSLFKFGIRTTYRFLI